ncbi:MAG TPA: TAXI family TRAP transporter solute-binding subunit [Gemmataceae bacterium]|nr:TAXI family TRAP transporter solute-binding subunit [Gemmataceae bacterium]
MALLGGVLAVAVAGSLFAALALLRPSKPRTYEVQLTTDTMQRTAALAEEIRAEGLRHRLNIAVSAKEQGTLSALEEVDSPGEIKCALIIGGVTSHNYPHVRAVTSLAKVHLHLLVKRDLADKGIAGLRGKHVALGPSTTASYHVARDVLNFVGLLPTIKTGGGDYNIDLISPREGLLEMARIESLGEPARAEAIARLPDAVMFLAPLPSPLARQLVTGFGYTLVPLPFAEAYGLDRLNPPGADGVRVNRATLGPGAIPAYTYGSDPAEPARECPTLCAPLILVAREDVPPEAVSLLLETIYDNSLTNAIRPPPLNEQVSAFPRHGGTEHYLHRNDPLLTPELAYKFGVLGSGVGAVLSGVIAVYGFLRLRHLNRFESYYREIGQIEMLARGLEHDPGAPTEVTALRSHLEGRLSALKCKVLEDFAEGGLRGEALMAGIVALINDTRDSLAGMVPAADGRRDRSPV